MKFHSGMRLVRRSTVLLEPYVVGIHIIRFKPQEVVPHATLSGPDQRRTAISE